MKTNKKNPYINKVFIFTESCGLCGTKDFDDIIKIANRFNLTVEVRQIQLYNGWKLESQAIGKKLKLEVPFIFCFDTQKGISLEDARKDLEKLEKVFTISK